MKFVKMHGCGNDYVYLDAVTEPAIEARIASADWSTLVQRMSDRHKGIGSDGVIVLCKPTDAAKSTGAHVRMRMFNADGSESEMCGNGIRCVTKFAHDRLGIHANPMLVETGRGVLSIAYETNSGKVVQATVDMGEPILDPTRIPVNVALMDRAPVGYTMTRGGTVRTWQFVSMGNPHAVTFWDDLGDRHRGIHLIRDLGPTMEIAPAFANRTNVHVVSPASRSHARVYTWERGAGITQACGTGICASLIAGVLAGHLEREATMTALGGELRIRWDEASNHVFMTGEAVDVFEGVWPDR